MYVNEKYLNFVFRAKSFMSIHYIRTKKIHSRQTAITAEGYLRYHIEVVLTLSTTMSELFHQYESKKQPLI